MNEIKRRDEETGTTQDRLATAEMKIKREGGRERSDRESRQTRSEKPKGK